MQPMNKLCLQEIRKKICERKIAYHQGQVSYLYQKIGGLTPTTLNVAR